MIASLQHPRLRRCCAARTAQLAVPTIVVALNRCDRLWQSKYALAFAFLFLIGWHRIIAADSFSDWQTSAPEAEGLLTNKLESLWSDLNERHTTALLIIRNDRIV